MSEGKNNFRSFLIYAAASTALLLVFLFLKKDNIITWVQAKATIREQKRLIEWYEKDTERLEEHVRAMTSNRDSLERMAREKYQFAAEGEDVYIVEE